MSQINTLQTDNSENVNINLLIYTQLEALYLHQASNIEIWVGVESPNKYHVSTPPCVPKSYQFVAYWKEEDGKLDLACERGARKVPHPATNVKMKAEAPDKTGGDATKPVRVKVEAVAMKKEGTKQGSYRVVHCGTMSLKKLISSF